MFIKDNNVGWEYVLYFQDFYDDVTNQVTQRYAVFHKKTSWYGDGKFLGYLWKRSRKNEFVAVTKEVTEQTMKKWFKKSEEAVMYDDEPFLKFVQSEFLEACDW